MTVGNTHTHTSLKLRVAQMSNSKLFHAIHLSIPMYLSINSPLSSIDLQFVFCLFYQLLSAIIIGHLISTHRHEMSEMLLLMQYEKLLCSIQLQWNENLKSKQQQLSGCITFSWEWWLLFWWNERQLIRGSHLIVCLTVVSLFIKANL